MNQKADIVRPYSTDFDCGKLGLAVGTSLVVTAAAAAAAALVHFGQVHTTHTNITEGKHSANKQNNQGAKQLSSWPTSMSNHDTELSVCASILPLGSCSSQQGA